MSLGTTIIGVGLLLLCILPIIILSYRSSSKIKKLIKALNDLAEKENSKISETDNWNRSIIGIDKNTKKLFYYKNDENNSQQYVIPLKDVLRCKLLKEQHEAGQPGNEIKLIDKIQLEFSFTNSAKEPIVLDFYNALKENLEPNEQLRLADKWKLLSGK